MHVKLAMWFSETYIVLVEELPWTEPHCMHIVFCTFVIEHTWDVAMTCINFSIMPQMYTANYLICWHRAVVVH